MPTSIPVFFYIECCSILCILSTVCYSTRAFSPALLTKIFKIKILIVSLVYIFLSQNAIVVRGLFQLQILIRYYRANTLVHIVWLWQGLMSYTSLHCVFFYLLVYCIPKVVLTIFCFKIWVMSKRLIFPVFVFLLYALCRTVICMWISLHLMNTVLYFLLWFLALFYTCFSYRGV
jgi:hypothetical protein